MGSRFHTEGALLYTVDGDSDAAVCKITLDTLLLLLVLILLFDDNRKIMVIDNLQEPTK